MLRLLFRLIIFAHVATSVCHAFVVPLNRDHYAPFVQRKFASGTATTKAKQLLTLTKSSSSLEMCICIDCARVTNCAAYHFVEEKHQQPHLTEDPTFTPRDGSPTIHVNIRTVRSNCDDEVGRMWREHASETERAEQKIKEQKNKKGDDVDEPLRGETVYDLSPVTTYEYDVVACEDFVPDKGCWIRNMPQEIKKANPSFVPT